jgi:uncharacterized protein
MLIQDKVYGEEEITEKVLIDLINSPTIQRLKAITQQGMPREYYHREIFSRFEHSIGVFLLLRKLGANLEEQIAGLLHDISHTAFSHVVDYVIGDPLKEDYQDNIFFEVLRKSEIPLILKKYNLDIEKFSNLEFFTLLEKEAPSLCADRIDYCLREFIDLGLKEKVEVIVNDLVSVDGQIVFKTKEVAQEFGERYAELQREHWAGNEARTRYYILAGVLKTALDEEYIDLQDFHKTDNELLEILSKIDNKDISEGLKKLKQGFSIKEVEETSEGIIIKKKFRYVDPEVLVEGMLKNLSSISEEYKDLLQREKEYSRKIIKIRIL